MIKAQSSPAARPACLAVELGPNVKGYLSNALLSPVWMPETAELV
jgi:hypothetical protein